MAVSKKDLKNLTSPMPYKWREQSVNARGATMVAYIDARQLFDKLDEVVGAGDWESDFKLVDGKLFGGIGINVDQGDGFPPKMVWKWDTGTESNVEKEKGEVSDAIKRAGVQFGVGRFLYSLGIVTLKSGEYNGKFKPADDSGKILWDRDAITNLCNQAIKEGKLDRTRLGQTSSGAKATESKPFLNKSTKEFEQVSAALKAKKATMAYVVSKFRLSKEVKLELEQLVK